VPDSKRRKLDASLHASSSSRDGSIGTGTPASPHASSINGGVGTGTPASPNQSSSISADTPASPLANSSSGSVSAGNLPCKNGCGWTEFRNFGSCVARFHHGFCRVIASPVGLWLARCAFVVAIARPLDAINADRARTPTKITWANPNTAESMVETSTELRSAQCVYTRTRGRGVGTTLHATLSVTLWHTLQVSLFLPCSHYKSDSGLLGCCGFSFFEDVQFLP
jgi:hypothetical protein